TTSGYLEFVIEPPIEVLTALLLAFVLGLGIAAIKGDALLNMMNEFKNIIELVISKVIIPLLPFHIFGIFSNMSHAGTVTTIIIVFLKVFFLFIILHLLYLLFIYFTAGTMSRQNLLQIINNMLLTYFTYLDTLYIVDTIFDN